MEKMDNVFTWNPWPILTSGNTKCKYAVIVLNRPIATEFNCNMIVDLWKNAAFRITVDGGSDAWLSWLHLNNFDVNSVVPPDLIIGDMDSISKKALQYFGSNESTSVVVAEDQSETDFTKSIVELRRYINCNALEIDDVIVFTAAAGRFDHLLSNVHTLFCGAKLMPKVKIYLFMYDSLTWLLPKGSHTIVIPANLRRNQEWCGLLPIGTPCKVTTTGLKWNLTKRILEFGQLVSTSNTYSGESEVVICTDGPVIWTMSTEKFSNECI